MTIGLFGFGVVGEGLYRILQQTPSLKAGIKKICIRNPDKVRQAPAELFITDREEILNDPEINLVVEVIDDSAAAFDIVSRALLNGKDVVSASKKMLAEKLPQLLQLQKETGRSLLYEASACASIPIIRNLEEYYDNDLLQELKAIVNGSTNYILTTMYEEGLSYRDALLQARQLGFAESNPVLDVEGHDAANKWILMLNHAYGIVLPPEKLVYTGIQNIESSDAGVAREKNYTVRLVAEALKLRNGKVAAFVLPQFVPQTDHLAFVRHEYNGVVLTSSFSDKQFFYGKGAGSFPTASAVLSDIAALRYGYRYEYKKLYKHQPPELTHDFYVRVYLSFDDLKHVPKDEFEWIDEWHAQAERKYLAGVIHFEKLAAGNWWKENNNSLILLPNAIIDDMEVRQLKKKSLELAGVSL